MVNPNNVVIEWEPVPTTITGSEVITIVGHQLVVEQEQPLRVFSIDLPASITKVKVPPKFFQQPDTEHKFGVLTTEESGNQTISAGEFIT